MGLKIDRNPVYNIYKELKLRSIISDHNLDAAPPHRGGLGPQNDPNWKILGKILANDQLRTILGYFCDYGAASNLILENRTGLPEGSVRRSTKQLKTWLIIFPSINAPVNKKGGPHAKINQVNDSTAEQILDAVKLHFKLKNPKYAVGSQLAQAMIDDYPMDGKAVHFRDIMTFVKTKTRFRPVDVANFTAEELHGRGIKVWR